jgi:hypothetical protein
VQDQHLEHVVRLVKGDAQVRLGSPSFHESKVIRNITIDGGLEHFLFCHILGIIILTD